MKTIRLMLLSLGVLCIIIQNVFYGYIDASGILHDSIFLPLGVFAAITGLSLLLITEINSLLKKR